MRQQTRAEESINPWTYRHRSTMESFYGYQNECNSPIKQLQTVPLRPNVIKPFQSKKRSWVRAAPPQLSERVHQYRIPKLSVDLAALKQIEKTLPCFTSGNFQSHLKPLKSHQYHNRLYLASNPKKLRSQVLEAFSRRQGKILRYSPQRAREVRRYYTEEKSLEDGQQEQHTVFESFSDILSINLIPQSTKRNNTMVLPKNNVDDDHNEQSPKKRQQVQAHSMTICHSRILGVNLSQMKRNFNLKRVQRFIKPLLSDS